MVIAIDGPAASGKGTLARRLAARLGLPHLDTGLLYRAVALTLIEREAPLGDAETAARAAAELELGRFDEADLRGRHIGEAASIVSAHETVRAALLDLQRRFAARPEGAVLDGRDIGTVVCPAADVKLFVTAAPEERARRRWRELQRNGEPERFETVLADVRRRDHRDETRSTAPLRAASDAVELDTTLIDADLAFERALAIVMKARPPA